MGVDKTRHQCHIESLEETGLKRFSRAEAKGKPTKNNLNEGAVARAIDECIFGLSRSVRKHSEEAQKHTHQNAFAVTITLEIAICGLKWRFLLGNQEIGMLEIGGRRRVSETTVRRVHRWYGGTDQHNLSDTERLCGTVKPVELAEW